MLPLSLMQAEFMRFGGFVEQNTAPVSDAYAYDVSQDRWDQIAPLPRPRGAAGAVVVNDLIHLIGGASAPKDERASVGWHEVYDVKTDQWSRRNCHSLKAHLFPLRITKPFTTTRNFVPRQTASPTSWASRAYQSNFVSRH
jgi:N-acetylneuraminic acid mutarotase